MGQGPTIKKNDKKDHKIKKKEKKLNTYSKH